MADKSTSEAITTLARETADELSDIPACYRPRLVAVIASALASVAQHDYKPAYELAQANADAALTECERLRAELAHARQERSDAGRRLIRAVRIFEPAVSSRVPSIEEVEKKARQLQVELAQARADERRKTLEARKALQQIVDINLRCDECSASHAIYRLAEEALRRLRDLPPVSERSEGQ